MDSYGTKSQGGVDIGLCRNFATGQIKAGKDRGAVTQRLIQMGMDPVAAGQLIDGIYAQSGNVVAPSAAVVKNVDSIGAAIVGGGLGALIGAVVWAAIITTTGFTIGFMAVGVGALCGFGVSKFSRGEKTVAHEVVAILWAVIGIIGGHYFAIVYMLNTVLATKGMPGIGYFSPGTVSMFFQNIGRFTNMFDILWIVLAISAAYKAASRE